MVFLKAVVVRWYDDDILQPAKLVDFEKTIDVRRVWSANVGAEARKYWTNLQPATSGDVVFAADHEGKVTALNATSGKRLWSVDLQVPVSGGVGYGADLVLLGTIEGQVLRPECRGRFVVMEQTVKFRNSCQSCCKR